mmetsp:Transcript_69994/g.221771  ORF Transcript_69994/g.221771 Transcript_69994/m.221771 type:complete len:322 (-) Transcript_69994:153-1118(-)
MPALHQLRPFPTSRPCSALQGGSGRWHLPLQHRVRAAAAPQEGEGAAPPRPRPPGPAVVLSSPQGLANVGSVARLCRNFQFADIRVSAPLYDVYDFESEEFHREVLAYASNSLILEDGSALVTREFDDAIGDIEYLVGTTARTRERTEVVPVREAAAELAALVAGGTKVGLLFGNERTGLTSREVAACDMMVAVPTSFETGYSSLNLSHAVGIVLYEVFLALDQEGCLPGESRAVVPTSDPERLMQKQEKAQLARQLLEASRALGVEEATTEASIERFLSSGGSTVQTRDAKFLFKIAKAVARGGGAGLRFEGAGMNKTQG